MKEDWRLESPVAIPAQFELPSCRMTHPIWSRCHSTGSASRILRYSQKPTASWPSGSQTLERSSSRLTQMEPAPVSTSTTLSNCTCTLTFTDRRSLSSCSDASRSPDHILQPLEKTRIIRVETSNHCLFQDVPHACQTVLPRRRLLQQFQPELPRPFHRAPWELMVIKTSVESAHNQKFCSPWLSRWFVKHSNSLHHWTDHWWLARSVLAKNSTTCCAKSEWSN